MSNKAAFFEVFERRVPKETLQVEDSKDEPTGQSFFTHACGLGKFALVASIE